MENSLENLENHSATDEDTSETNILHPSRTSQTQFLGLNRRFPLVRWIAQRLERLFQPSSPRASSGPTTTTSSPKLKFCLEPIGCNRYKEGQEFQLHHDVCELDDADNVMNPEEASFSRLFSALLYLNDDFVGGSTAFPRLNLNIKPKAGTLVFWTNVNGDGLTIDNDVIHCGQQVTKGVKYCCNFWMSFKKANDKTALLLPLQEQIDSEDEDEEVEGDEDEADDEDDDNDEEKDAALENEELIE